MTRSQQADDRVLSATMWAAAIVGVVLAAAGVILYGLPTETGRLWAWDMGPPMTVLAVGGGYLAGATFFLRALREPRWHVIGLTFVAATVLSGLLGVATFFLHWELFNHQHVSFWAWAVLYVAAPLLLPVLWARNRQHDPGDAAATVRVPDGLRKLVGAVGVIQGAAALAFYVHPPLVIEWWPWQLSPLTTRTIFSFFGFIAVVWLAFLWEDRWSALRLHVETATLGLVLVGFGAFRAGGDLTGSPALVALVFGLLTATVVAAVSLYLYMQRSARAEVPTPDRARHL